MYIHPGAISIHEFFLLHYSHLSRAYNESICVQGDASSCLHKAMRPHVFPTLYSNNTNICSPLNLDWPMDKHMVDAWICPRNRSIFSSMEKLRDEIENCWR